MNENLMVNSKTDILEFKRKHNLLVENGIIKSTVSNIKQLTNADIENLSCGDVVLKEDESGKHAYLVSFKSDTGLCLTYCDASCVETQSYDKVGENWQYNSEDKLEMTKPVYWHTLEVSRNYGSSTQTSSQLNCIVIILNNNSTPINNESFTNLIKSPGFVAVVHAGIYKPTGEISTFKEVINIAYYAENQFSVRYYSDDKTTIQTSIHYADTFIVNEIGNNKIN